MFLLDTNIVSELRKTGDSKADANVIAWLSSVDAAILYLSAITLMEIQVGVLRIERRDAAQGARLRAWMTHHVLPEFPRSHSAHRCCRGASLCDLACTGLSFRAGCTDRGNGPGT